MNVLERRFQLAAHDTTANDLGERVAALGGQFRLEVPPGGGTRLVAQLPLAPVKGPCV